MDVAIIILVAILYLKWVAYVLSLPMIWVVQQVKVNKSKIGGVTRAMRAQIPTK